MRRHRGKCWCVTCRPNKNTDREALHLWTSLSHEPKVCSVRHHFLSSRMPGLSSKFLKLQVCQESAGEPHEELLSWIHADADCILRRNASPVLHLISDCSDSGARTLYRIVISRPSQHSLPVFNPSTLVSTLALFFVPRTIPIS